MSTNTIDAVRTQNQVAGGVSKDVDLATLDNFQLPRDVTEEFLDRAQKEVQVLEMADTMVLERLEMDVPMFGVPQLSGSTRAEEGTRTSNSANSDGDVAFNATDQQYYILVEPTRDALKNTHYGPDQFGDYIVDQFIQRWFNDVGLIGIRANADSGNLQSIGGAAALDSTWNGWIAIAEGEDTASDRMGLETTAGGEVDTMPTVDMASSSVDTKMFNDAIQTLDSRYRDPDNFVFLTSPDVVQEYVFSLTEREDPLGSAVIFGDNDITPFSYDVVGVNGWPDSYAMLTDPDNLAFGVFEEMELDQTTDTDKVHENRLHSRNWLEGQFDFQIKQMQAGVLVENIA
ncbi:hypothetical protein [Haloarcula pellucida]|uniref:Phage major capsid protein, HK97 family n=1 Tax=Haloarcula pellucida TaxID=1427151 RepID=A0A830GRX7_9EURY|nr:hypothetical protein [Halomicroarcula pellucida]MBX0350376.1 hypothetical protein [Halomicroarcula pellucida]GGO01775.1 hypothetical protein GCM10009030_35800 [Halomicroarcula pellucida]